MKDWEWLGIGAALIAIGLVIENNAGKIKGAISNIHDNIITPSISTRYRPISTTPSIPDLSSPTFTNYELLWFDPYYSIVVTG